MLRRIRRTCLALALNAAWCGATATPGDAATPSTPTLTPVALRCEGQVDPLGIDAAVPRLSWELRGQGRGLRQTGWQVLVASSPEVLARDEGDLWDSGRVADDRQLHVPIAGRPLTTGQQVFWKVRVWDGAGQPSAWSAPATWTAGVLGGESWPAAWITSARAIERTRRHLGFSSEPADDPAASKWLQLDLGAVYAIDRIRLHALTHTVPERLGFPRWFRLEVATQPDFSDATVVADHTGEPTNLWLRSLTFDVPGVRARFVRLTATQLRRMREDDLPAGAGESVPRERGRLALSQIEVRSDGINVAPGARVTASDSLESDWWSATAVVDGLGVPGSDPRANETLRLRREFVVRPGLRRAIAFVCGLGHSTLHVNGREIGDALLSPGWTDAAKTCLYDTHDLTAALAAGPNALGLTLAGGMYRVPPPGDGRYTKFVGPERPLVAIAQLRLEYVDGSVEVIGTDGQWQTAPGPVTYAHVYGGLDYDARRETPGWDRAGFDAREWTRAVEVAGPGGRLRGAGFAGPPLRPQETLRPVAVRSLRPGVEVYDLGQNAALSIRLRVRGSAGASVKVIPAELLRDDGSVDRGSVGGAESSWNYVLAGRPAAESWVPRLFYHGARYLQVERTAPDGVPRPEIELLEGVVVHADAGPVGEFACSNELFNRIRSLVRWAQRSNLAHVLTDCPHRERLGWLEQYHLNGPSLRYEYDGARLFPKTFRDMVDAQRPTGLVPNTAPEYVRFEGGFRDSPEWGCALILAAWQHFVWTGDAAPLQRHYGAMVRYADYLATRADGHLLSHGLGDWYDLGPNRPGFAQLTPVALTATAFHFLVRDRLAMIAAELGRPDEAAQHQRHAEEIGRAFNAAFFDSARALYATGSQTAQALPLAVGLVPAGHESAVLASLVQDVQSRGNALTAGDVGYRFLLRALADGGRSDVIHAMTDQVDQPGYGYQLARGATSLTEAWDANRHSSQNHFMLGQIMEWFYADVAGLAPDPAAPGFGAVVIRPRPVGDLTWAQARHHSPRGPIHVRWERQNGQFILAVELPPNSRAIVFLPAGDPTSVREGGAPAAERPGVRLVRAESECMVYQIDSGHYRFESRLPAVSPVVSR